MKQFFVIVFSLVQYFNYAQSSAYSEKPPMFPACDSISFSEQEKCFNNQIHTVIYNNFKVPEKVLAMIRTLGKQFAASGVGVADIVVGATVGVLDVIDVV